MCPQRCSNESAELKKKKKRKQKPLLFSAIFDPYSSVATINWKKKMESFPSRFPLF